MTSDDPPMTDLAPYLGNWDMNLDITSVRLSGSCSILLVSLLNAKSLWKHTSDRPFPIWSPRISNCACHMAELERRGGASSGAPRDACPRSQGCAVCHKCACRHRCLLSGQAPVALAAPLAHCLGLWGAWAWQGYSSLVGRVPLSSGPKDRWQRVDEEEGAEKDEGADCRSGRVMLTCLLEHIRADDAVSSVQQRRQLLPTSASFSVGYSKHRTGQSYDVNV